jgi:carbon-monoxide dehydrogenase small subunit
MSHVPVTLTVNGSVHQREVSAGLLLTDFLRQQLDLHGTKVGCNNGICGSCTVLLDGAPVRACLLLAVQADDRALTTIEGLAGDHRLHPLQEAFVEHGAVQCGFCIPGMIMSAAALLQSNPRPTETDIKRALEGNLCRCTGYSKIVEAVRAAADELRC